MILSFSLTSFIVLIELKNPLNIRNEVNAVTMVDTPENSTTNVLIIFSDGLRFDKLLEANTPNIDLLRANGVTFSNFRASLPSYSHPNYVSLFTGSTPNITNAASNFYNDLVTLPTLFGEAQANGYTTGIVTISSSWNNLFGAYFDNFMKVSGSYSLPKANFLVYNASLAYIPGNFSNIQYIVFDETDVIGHEYGAASEEYIDCIEELDGYVGDILAMYDSLGKLSDTTIVFVSDHGHDDKGGHGSSANQETHATLILAGKGIYNTGITISKKVNTNYLTPTLLCLLGIPLGPQMNGEIVFEALDIPIKTKAAFSIQSTEIMLQQQNATLSLMKALSKNKRDFYFSEIASFVDDLTSSKATYIGANYNVAFTSSQEVHLAVRTSFGDLFNNYLKNIRAIRIIIILSCSILLLLPIIIWNVKLRDKLEGKRIFNTELILPELLGFASFIILHAAITQFRYGPKYIEDTMGLIMPNLYSIVIGGIVAIFLPWLLVLLLLRKKKTDYTRFKDWRTDFLKSSVGSLLFVTAAGLSYALYYIYVFGPWPSWQIPETGHNYAYMMIGLVTSAISLFGIILTIALLFVERQEAKKAWLVERGQEVFNS